MTQVVSITSKGQATIPKELREKYGFTNKASITETPEGLLFKPLPTPEEEFGSLRKAFREKYGEKSIWTILDEEKELEEIKEKKLRLQQ